MVLDKMGELVEVFEGLSLAYQPRGRQRSRRGVQGAWSERRAGLDQEAWGLLLEELTLRSPASVLLNWSRNWSRLWRLC